jgi:hypothetical protein
MLRSLVSRLFVGLATAVDHRYRWHRLPTPLGLVLLVAIRKRLREQNLYDTSLAMQASAPLPPPSDHYRTARSADGAYNDPDNPAMGRARERFGRNALLEKTFPDSERLLKPNPRTVSRELLTRDKFVPATTLNVIAGAWLQCMIRDWFSHGRSPKENPWKVPLAEDDPWPEHPMQIMKTPTDPTRTPEEDAAGLPPTYINVESPWWGGLHLYGGDEKTQAQVRLGQDGKLKNGEDGLIPVDPNSEKHPADEPGFWLGVAMLHSLFTREHNAICDRLKAQYPHWSDDDLFDHARLVNSALLAKIHTVERTAAILGHPALQIGMRANWWGLMGERVSRLIGRISDSEAISGIVGGPTNHFNVPYSLTEEVVAVYRMHPLIPDEYAFRSSKTDALLEERPFSRIDGRDALEILSGLSMDDLFYSFGIAHPGAVILHKFPRDLQFYEREDGIIQDLAVTDILRSRELGVPRYNEFRRVLHLKAIERFEDLTDNPTWLEELRRVYEDDVELLDLTVGMYAEKLPEGFGFSDTAFRIFVLMASRRLNSDRFFTTHFNAEVYSQAGLDWIADNDMSSVLKRHYPALAPAMQGVKNAFAPWSRVA